MAKRAYQGPKAPPPAPDPRAERIRERKQRKLAKRMAALIAGAFSPARPVGVAVVVSTPPASCAA